MSHNKVIDLLVSSPNTTTELPSDAPDSATPDGGVEAHGE